MTDNTNALALITPLKDEIENIQKFLDSIKLQTIPIKCLIIVENDSTDGSKEYLDEIKNVENVERFEVVHMSFEDKSYRVGKKYATIINKGMEHLKQMELYKELDFVGILDCDVFPENDYYGKLLKFLNDNPRIGITSGLTFTPEGTPHIADPEFVRGNSRVWKKKCLEEAGYLVAHTADTVSVALAHLKGWKTKTLKSAKVISREVDVRLGNPQSKGYHAYYRGHTLLYMMLKFFHFALFKGRLRTGYVFLSGYLSAMMKRKERIDNRKVRQYFRYYYLNKITNKY